MPDTHALDAPGAPPVPMIRTPAPSLALAGLALASLLASLGASTASIGLPALAHTFAAPVAAVQWVLMAYLLASTAAAVGIGAIGDRHGRRRTLLAGVALFGAASALCGAAGNLPMLVAARAAQGLGAAAMTTLAIGFVGDVVPRERSGRAMGLLATTSAIGTTLGLVLGGGLLAAFGWRALFLALLAPGVLAFLLLRSSLPADQPGFAGRVPFDVQGAAVLAAALVAFVLALSIDAGRYGAINALLLATSVAAVLLFLRRQRTALSPLVDLTLFRISVLRAGLIATMLVTAVVMSLLVVGPYYLGRGLGLDPARAGLAMAAGPLVSALTGVPAGRLVDRFGTYGVILAGLLVMVVGAGVLAVVPPGFGVLGYVVPLTLITGGYSAFQAANNTAVVGSVDAPRRGIVGGLTNLARNLGLASGTAVMGAVFASGASTVDPSDSTAVVVGLHRTFGLAFGLLLVAMVVSARRR